mmetsp:Transcript_37343/g.75319  ORF Transcript_37343/g.75319 Transcript_37343/m.75319 type:complete len:131 (-) Transcript_37343:328-720(-)
MLRAGCRSFSAAQVGVVTIGLLLMVGVAEKVPDGYDKHPGLGGGHGNKISEHSGITLAACADACDSDAACVAIVWFPHASGCKLKSAVVDPAPHFDRDTYAKSTYHFSFSSCSTRPVIGSTVMLSMIALA